MRQVWYDDLGPILESLVASLAADLKAERLALWILRLDGRHFLEDPPRNRYMRPRSPQKGCTKPQPSGLIDEEDVDLIDPEAPAHRALVLEAVFPEFCQCPLGFPRTLPEDDFLYRLMESDQRECVPLGGRPVELLGLPEPAGRYQWICRLANGRQMLGLIAVEPGPAAPADFGPAFEQAWKKHVIQWERLQLEASLARRTRILEAIQAVGNTITSQLEIHDILQSVVEQATVLMKAKTASLMLVNPETNELVLESVYGSSPDYIRKPNLDIETSLVGRVVKSGRPIMVRDVRACEAYQHRELAHSEGLVSLLSVPLRWRDRCMGALNVYAARRYRYTADNIYLLTLLASQSAIAIQNARTLSQAKHLEEQVHDLDKRSMIGELAAGVAHEIRNPLAVVKMLIDNWESHNAAEAEDIRVIASQLHGINRCVTQLLEVARPRPSEFDWITLPREIQAIVQLLRLRLRDQGIDLLIDLPEELPEVRVDVSQLRQLLMNLLLNALNVMPQGGRISVHAWRMEGREMDSIQGETIVPFSQAGDSEGLQQPVVCLSLSDTGGGIREDEVRGIFEPFKTGTPGGFGLGLVVVKRIVEDHGAGLKVLNHPGEGLTFFLFLRARPIDPGNGSS
ncbi:MAG: GAF domain-containing protein [Candidatus Omnitrophica bacterium]|nr:GAF domain-containing protein [Candidatus Omnitrophota bacterium]NUP92965.1 GAF domain-containing protein [Candidatus Omnitrophota bacterium]